MTTNRLRHKVKQALLGGPVSSGRRLLALGVTFGLVLSVACTGSLPQRHDTASDRLVPKLSIELAPSLEAERSSYESDVLAAIAEVANFFSFSGFELPEQRVIDSVIVFDTPLAAREYLSKELGAPLDAIPDTFAGTVAEKRLFLVSRRSYRQVWRQLYPEWAWSERTYRSLIVHEIAHRMHEAIVRERFGTSDAMGPVWFFEGLAITCAKQFQGQQVPLSREELRQLVCSGHSPAVSYPLYGRIVRSLAAEFGVQVLVSKATEPGFPEMLWAAQK